MNISTQKTQSSLSQSLESSLNTTRTFLQVLQRGPGNVMLMGAILVNRCNDDDDDDDDD